MAGTAQRNWWKDAIIYQIYPASFKDGNGDGLGDLPGIISKLDYIKNLGADTIWISPMYDSPQIDMGYDISNYESVYPPYGTVEDMEVLIKETHARGMRILLDLVINHTSDQHTWFKESRSSRDNPKRDWYHWKDAKYDKEGRRLPPNNWRSNFSTGAWTWDERTEQYYLNLFCPEQPDLKWENESTRKAIYDTAIHFWMKRGVDGFRVDTVNMYSKGDMADAPIVEPDASTQPAGEVYCNGPQIHEFIREMHREALAPYGDTMTVGELPNAHDLKQILSYVSASDPQLSMVFQFDVVDLGTGGAVGRPKFELQPFPLSKYKATWSEMQQLTRGNDGWSSAFCENHDQGRSISRFATDSPAHRTRAAKMLATQMATLTGTLFVYNGQEIGMVNAPLSWPLDEYIDIDSINYIKSVKERHGDDQARMDEVKRALRVLARDHARLPMQWDGSPQAGFSTNPKTWMRVHDDYPSINVKRQEEDPDSVLNYWRTMLKFRKEHSDTCVHGNFKDLDPANEKTFTYTKTLGGHRILVALNFSDDEEEIKTIDGIGECVVCNYDGKPKPQEKLRPWEARVYSVM